MYPSGDTERNKGWLSVFLGAKPTDDMDFKMSVEWSIINVKGEKVFVMRDSEENENSVSVYKDGGWGEQHFIQLTDIFNPNNNLLKNGSLTLACKIQSFKLMLSKSQTSLLKTEKEESLTIISAS